MALPGSGSISFSQLQTEFGGSNPISMSEYYRNGAYTTSNNTNVPTSGTIQMSNFHGATAFVADYTPAAIDWPDVFVASSGGSSRTGNTASRTISGTNSTFTMKVTMTAGGVTGNFESGYGDGSFSVTPYVNGSAKTGIITFVGGAGSSVTVSEFTVPTGATIYFAYEVVVNDQLGGWANGNGQGSFSVTNTTTGGTAIDTFTLNIST